MGEGWGEGEIAIPNHPASATICSFPIISPPNDWPNLHPSNHSRSLIQWPDSSPSTTSPGITEAEFRDKLNAVRKWRPDRRTTVLKVYGDLENGRLVSECEAVEQAHFEDWLKMVGWPAESINKVDIICQVGSFWKL